MTKEAKKHEQLENEVDLELQDDMMSNKDKSANYISEEYDQETNNDQKASLFIQDQILPYFSDSQKETVKLILKFLSKTNSSQPKISIAPDLSIMVDNEHLKSSNIIDILKKLVSMVPVRCINTDNNSNCYKYLEKASKIVGLKEVVTKLSLLNFPLTSIPNALLALAMREMKSK